MRIRKLAKDITIILIITLIIIVLPEIILRILFPKKAEKITTIFSTINLYLSAPSFIDFNKDYGYALKAGKEYSLKRNKLNGGDIIISHTNKNSFRGAELKDNPNKRIIVYGDSMIQAVFSTLENTFAMKLEKYLSSDGLTDIEVVNAGIMGFGPDQSLIKFKNEADLYHPNLVIFSIFADNDFGDILRNRIFDLDENGELINSEYNFTIEEFNSLRIKTIKSYISYNLLTLRAIKKLFFSLSKVGKAEQSKKNNFLQKLSEKEQSINDLLERSESEYSIYKKSRPRRVAGDHYDMDIALNPGQESSKIKIKLMEEVLIKANDFARSKNIEFLVLILPSVIDLTKENYSINYEELQKYPNYQRANLTNAVEKICVSHNINYINLFEVFKNSNPEQLYFRGKNNHWNDQGQDIAARETASFIHKREMLRNDN